MSAINQSYLNSVKNRFLPLPKSAVEGLEHEPTIDDFTVIRELGIGSFGTVYLVAHKKTKAQYALKVIDKNLPDNLEEKDSFCREVEIMYKLNHPNIVKLYGHFEDDNCCYFIMQYIPKRSLFEIITKPRETPNLKLISSVMKDLLSAVYYLHNMKPIIIHRDIKPENILLGDNSRAYLTDFGWSNYIINEKRRQTVCGSPLYLPPEMVSHIGHDETVDIWCIGVLLFELITGKPPFAGNNIETVKYNISKLNISWPPVMDPDARDLCGKILKLNGKDRLPIEQILNHNFFKKFCPNAIKELIKPENQKSGIFVVSVDDPKKWGEQINHINGNKTFKKIPVVNIEKNPFTKAKDFQVSRTNVDSSTRKNEEDKNKALNSSYNTRTIPSAFNNHNNSNNNTKKVNFDTSVNIRNSNKGSILNRSNTNNYRDSYKDPVVNKITNFSKYSKDNYRNSYRYPISIKYNSNTSNINSNNKNNNNKVNSSFNANTNPTTRYKRSTVYTKIPSSFNKSYTINGTDGNNIGKSSGNSKGKNSNTSTYYRKYTTRK